MVRRYKIAEVRWGRPQLTIKWSVVGVCLLTMGRILNLCTLTHWTTRNMREVRHAVFRRVVHPVFGGGSTVVSPPALGGWIRQ